MRIAIVDTYYPEFIAANPLQGGTYAEELQRILECRFGTFDAYSRGLRALGHEVIDIIANHGSLQKLWADENKIGSSLGWAIASHQILRFAPDVVFLQDLSVFPLSTLVGLKTLYTLAGQCSCRFDDEEKL